MHRSLLLFFPTVLLLGCSNLVNVEVEDSGAGFAEAEVVYTRHPQHGEPQRRYETIEAGYSRSSGKSTQSLSGYEYLDINGQQLAAPATLDNDVDLELGYLQWLAHNWYTPKFEDYLGGGLAYADFQYEGFYEGASGTQAFRFAEHSLGLASKLGATYHFTPVYAVDGNMGIYLFLQNDEAYLVTTDLRLLMTPADAVQLFAGYRRWGYTLVEPQQSRSSIKAVLTGPLLGVTLRF